MIHLLFELTDLTDVLDDFSRGHITLTGDRETVSSKDVAEDMMIFVEIIRILDDIQRILLTSQKSYKFESLNSRPFIFEMNKISLGQMRVVFTGRTMGEASLQDFIQTLWQSVVVFVGQYRAALPNTHTIAEDLDRAMQGFKHAMTAYQPPMKKKPKHRQ